MTFSINDDHLLVNSDTSVQYFNEQTASKNSKTYAQSGGVLDTLIIHFTAGRSAISSARYLARPDIRASAHLVIGRAGEVYQLVPFDKVAWHAGTSQYGGRSGYNKYSIGIELDNAGPLVKTGNQYQAWFGTRYPASDVIHATHKNETRARYWHTYTEQQLETLSLVSQLIVEKYNLKDILGHDDISPGRKQDPGPAFDLARFKRNILGQDRSSEADESAAPLPEAGKVVASKLNIRAGAGSGFEKVAKPLPKGAPVKILSEENGWYEVEATVKGWVSKGFIAGDS